MERCILVQALRNEMFNFNKAFIGEHLRELPKLWTGARAPSRTSHIIRKSWLFDPIRAFSNAGKCLATSRRLSICVTRDEAVRAELVSRVSLDASCAALRKGEEGSVKLARTELMSLSMSTLQRCFKASLTSVNLSSDWTNSEND